MVHNPTGADICHFTNIMNAYSCTYLSARVKVVFPLLPCVPAAVRPGPDQAVWREWRQAAPVRSAHRHRLAANLWGQMMTLLPLWGQGPHPWLIPAGTAEANWTRRGGRQSSADSGARLRVRLLLGADWRMWEVSSARESCAPDCSFKAGGWQEGGEYVEEPYLILFCVWLWGEDNYYFYGKSGFSRSVADIPGLISYHIHCAKLHHCKPRNPFLFVTKQESSWCKVP